MKTPNPIDLRPFLPPTPPDAPRTYMLASWEPGADEFLPFGEEFSTPEDAIRAAPSNGLKADAQIADRERQSERTEESWIVVPVSAWVIASEEPRR